MEPLFGPASLENPLFTAMHINEMPEDCLRLVIESLSIGSSLNELVQKAFVCSSWFTVIQALMRLWHGTSLKLFESERNFDLYRRFVISDCRLNQVDARFALKEPLGKSQPPLPWTEQDHLMLRRFTGVSLRLISTALGAFFGDQVDHLVIHTFDIVQTDILRAFPLLTSLTFVELPDDQDVQADIWKYLNTSHRHLKHLAIFHSASAEPLNPVLLGPVLSRLESFTLDRYIHANRFAVFSHLNPEVCTRISVGRLGSWREAKLFREQFTSELPDLAPALVLLEMNPWAFARRRTVPFTWRDPHDRTEERFNVQEHRRAIFDALVIGRLNRLDAEVEEEEAGDVDPQVPHGEDRQDRRARLRNRIIQEWINYEAANEDNDDDWLDVWALNPLDAPLVRRWLQALPPEQIRTLFDPIRLSPERVQAEDVLLGSFTELCEAQRQHHRGEEAEEELENPLIGEMAMEALELGHPPEELPELIANLQAMARGLVRPEELPHGLRPLAHRVPAAPAGGAIQNRPVPMDALPPVLPPAEPVAVAAVNAERGNPVMFLRNFIQAGRRAGGVLLRGMFRRHHPLPQPNHPREEIIVVNQDAIEEVEEEEESDNEDDEIEAAEDEEMAIDVIEVDIENNNYHHHHHHHHHQHAVVLAQERQHRELAVENGEMHGLMMPENLLRIQGIAFARDRGRENQEAAQVAPPPLAGPLPTRMIIPSRENTLLRLQKVVQLRERRRREEQRAAAAAAADAAAANEGIPADGGAVVVGAEAGPVAGAGLVRPYQEHVNQDAIARRRRARALHPRNNRLWAAAVANEQAPIGAQARGAPHGGREERRVAREQQALRLAPEGEAPLLLGEWPRPGRARRLAMLRRAQW